MQPAAAAIAQRQIATIRSAAWQLLGTARDLPGDVEALAAALHGQECGCGNEPDEDTVIRASGLVQAGWRHNGTAALDLANLLAEIATAWQSAGAQPTSTCEQLRWTPVCVLAARIATEAAR